MIVCNGRLHAASKGYKGQESNVSHGVSVMPAGRPTEYKPEYKQEIVRLMETGLSLTAAAAEMGFVKQTIYNWGHSDPEFMDAITLGHGKRTLFLEKRLLGADTGPVVTSSIFALKNAAPDEWRERVVNEHTGKDGGAIQTEDLSPRDAARELLFMLAKAKQGTTCS